MYILHELHVKTLVHHTNMSHCSLDLAFKKYLMQTYVFSFLPRDASAERGDATVSRLSVCPSVRP